MLIEFKFSNYRSFRDEAVLSMEATGVSAFKKSLIEFYPTGKETGNPVKLLPSVAILRKERRRKEQHHPCFLAGSAVYSQCPAHTA